MADFLKIVSGLSVDERINRAKSLSSRLIDHCNLLVRIHYSNSELVYADYLAAKVPRSYAAHTFNLLQITQFRFEMIRLSAIWDAAREDRESIPTLLELIRDPRVCDELQRRHEQQWLRPSDSITLSNDDLDETEKKAIIEIIMQREREEAKFESCKMRKRLALAILAADQLVRSDKIKALTEFRDTQLAHNLGQKASKILPEKKTKFGDEKYILDRTLNIVSCLNLGIRGASFEWLVARKTSERYAKAFWGGLSLNVLE